MDGWMDGWDEKTKTLSMSSHRIAPIRGRGDECGRSGHRALGPKGCLKELKGVDDGGYGEEAGEGDGGTVRNALVCDLGNGRWISKL